MEAAQALTSVEGCDGELLFVSYTSASTESAAQRVQDSVTTEENPEEQKELGHSSPLPSKTFVLEGLFSAV